MSRTVGLTFDEPKIRTDASEETCGYPDPENTSNIGDIIDFQSMTVPELKAYAADMGVDLIGATKKDDIIKRILEPAEV